MITVEEAINDRPPLSAVSRPTPLG